KRVNSGMQFAIDAYYRARSFGKHRLLLRVRETGFIKRLTRELIEQRLGIESLEMAHTAREEDPDHVLCARRKMWLAVRLRVSGGIGRRRIAIVMQHRSER